MFCVYATALLGHMVDCMEVYQAIKISNGDTLPELRLTKCSRKEEDLCGKQSNVWLIWSFEWITA